MQKTKIVRIMENDPKPEGLLLHSQHMVTHHEKQSLTYKDDHDNIITNEVLIPVKQVVSFYQVPCDE